MNVYDFDKTIYDGDSTLDFYIYCLKRYPAVILCIPVQLFYAFKYKTGKINKTQFKEHFYIFLRKLDNTEDIICRFWEKNERKIKSWYLNRKKEDDVIISASPYFLLNEICKRIGIKHLIASNVDLKTGKYTGLNCYGEEKVRRFKKEVCGDIDNFYTDSKSDLPLMLLAKKSFFVKGNKIVER